MKEYEQFENKISKIFQDYSPEVSNDMIWNAVESKLPNKKKNRRFFILLFGLGLFIIVGILFNKSKIGPSQSNQIIDNTVSSENEVTTIENKIPPTENAFQDGIITNSIDDNSKINSTSSNESATISNKLDLVRNKYSLYSNLKAVSPNDESINMINNDPEIVNVKNASITAKDSNYNIVIKPIATITDFTLFDYFRPAILAFRGKLVNPKLFNNRYWKPSHEWFTSVGVYANNYIYSSEVQHSYYLNERKSTESDLETLEFDLGYRYQFKKRWSLSAGIRYWNYTERSTYQIETEKPVTIKDTLIGYLYAENNIATELYGETTVIENNKQRFIRFNNYQNISIPMIIRYDLIKDNRFGMSLGLGFEKSIWSKRSGFYLDHLANEYDLSLDKDGHYKNTNGDYLLLDLNFKYHFKKHYSLFLAIASKTGVNAYTNSNAPVTKRNNFYGLQLGTNFKF